MWDGQPEKKKKKKRLCVKTSCGRVEDNFTGGDESGVVGRVIWLDTEIHKKRIRTISRHRIVSMKLNPSRNTGNSLHGRERGSGERLEQEAVVNDSGTLKLDVRETGQENGL